MKKKSIMIVSISVLVIIVAGLIFYFSSSIKLVPSIFIKGAVVTEKGSVIQNVINSSAGQPMFLRVKKEGGILSESEIKVIYHANNIPCVKDAIYIKTGENVEIHGVAVADDTISTCGSSDYYIKSLATTSSQQNSGNNKTQSVALALDFFAGGSIFGSSFEVKISGTHITYLEISGGRAKESSKIDRSLLPVELDNIRKTISDIGLISLRSQYLIKVPSVPDQASYRITVSLDGKENKINCGIPPSGTEPTTKCQKQIDKLRLKLNSILGVNIY